MEYYLNHKHIKFLQNKKELAVTKSYNSLTLFLFYLNLPKIADIIIDNTVTGIDIIMQVVIIRNIYVTNLINLPLKSIPISPKITVQSMIISTTIGIALLLFSISALLSDKCMQIE